jgi:hypothetical protein
MKRKMLTFTFRDGVTVVGALIDGTLSPFEYKSQINAENCSEKYFQKGIYTTLIKSYGNPDKFYLKVIDYKNE